ncbi:ADP-ribosylglycohydrolase family protein [Streptomyces sp. NPDC020141]|uniref:ADP-ribosylglycohydrolase family protein n=1 Tax=Streptomyces sp. NPDC020141 TaxID=3365065 RepID=UPI0037ABFE47
MTGALRLTWVQPEDLVGHELRQAAEDGRDAAGIAAVWRAAGGPCAPPAAGASPAPAAPALRALADRLLDELAALPAPLAALEPTDLPAIRAACPDWPAPPARPAHRAPDPAITREPAPAAAQEPDPAIGQEPAVSTRAAPVSSVTPASPVTPTAPASGTDHRTASRPPAPAPTPAPAPAQPPPPPLRSSARAVVVSPLVVPPPVVSAAGVPAADRAGISPAGAGLTVEALHAAWLGRAAGCLLGKPVEKIPLHGIRALARATGNWPLRTWFTAEGLPAELARAHPWNRRSAPTSLAENIDGMPEDDDLDYPLLNLLLLQRYGRGFRTADVARLWLDELPAGRAFTAERVAYRNLLSGVEPPLTALRRNPFREWIGAAIRADVHGWTCPGDPGAAAEQAHRDATLTHTANGVHSAMFVAAAIASAAGGGVDVHGALAAGLTVVPPRSRLARAVRLGIEEARAEDRFDAVVDRLHSVYGDCHWVHSVPNAALLAAALTHADGDFTGSICRAVSGGWDTDSNGATAGSLAGLLAGRPDALPRRWTEPLRNRLATSVGGFDGIGFDALARLTHQEALRP